MKRNLNNINELVNAMMKNSLAVAKHFEEQGDRASARKFTAEANAFFSVLSALSSKEDFDKYCEIFF